MTKFIEKNSLMPQYLQFPRFLLEMEQINENAKMIYMLLLDRARLSQQNTGWRDEEGRIFVIFTISELAGVMRKGETAIKKGLQVLERQELILRRHQGRGRPNLIYVKIPVLQEECSISDRRITDCKTGAITPFQTDAIQSAETGRKRTGNKKEKNKNEINQNDYFYTEEECL